jgi:MoaA/NifB/PqqE/SkfB family radical SAM enzyme
MLSRPLYLLPFDHAGAEQPEWDGATEEITFTRPVGQVFRCAHGALHRLEVFLEPTFHYKRSHLWLHLYEGDLTGLRPAQRGAPVRVAGPLATEQILAHGWIGFEFQPVSTSAGKTFTAVFEAPDAGPGNALSLRAAVGPRSSARGLLVAGQPRPGALAFRAACLRAPELWPNFVRFRAGSRERQGTVAYRPLLARLEISRPCNLHCVMCLRGLNPFDAGREGTAFMSPATFQALDPLLPDLLWLIAFGLGEPFLNPHYLSMLRHARSRNAFVHIFTSTNGMVLKDEAIAAIVAERLLSTLQVSLDGAERATFEAIRVKANYDVVLRTLERIIAERARHRESELLVRGAMLVMKPNVSQVYDFIRLMASTGVDLISLDSPKGETFRPLRADTSDDMARIYEQVVRGHESLAGTSAIVDGPLLSELHEWHQRTGQTGALPRWGYDECARLRDAAPVRSSACPVPWESFNLAADGEVRVCCNSNRHMGRLPAEKMTAVWENGQPFGQLRDELVRRHLHSDCRTCIAENTVIPGELTPPLYLAGCIANTGATAWLASLLGRRVDLSALTDELAFTASIEPVSPRASSGQRLHGWVTGELPRDLLLVVCIGGVARGLAAPVTLSPQVAQWSVWLDSTDALLPLSSIALLRVTRSAQGAQLSLVPQVATASTAPSPASGTGRTLTATALRHSSALTGFIDEVRVHDGFAYVIGWVRDGATRTPAHSVTALLDGQQVRTVRPWLDRPDVARFHGDAPAHFGFALELPLPALASTGRRQLTLLAQNQQGEVASLAWGPKHDVIAPFAPSAKISLRIYRENDTTWLAPTTNVAP